MALPSPARRRLILLLLAPLLSAACLPPPGIQPVRARLDLRDTVALLAADGYYRVGVTGVLRGSSNLYRVLSSGVVEPALIAGDLSTERLEAGSDGCLYADGCRIEVSTGRVWYLGRPGSWDTVAGGGERNPQVQLDEDGGVWYWGQAEYGWVAALHRLDGETVEIREETTDWARVDDFVVRSDGTVFVAGESYTLAQNCIRRYPLNGPASTVVLTGEEDLGFRFLQVFPDGAVYTSFGGQGGRTGIYRLGEDGVPDATPSVDTAGEPDLPAGGAYLVQLARTNGGDLYGLDTHAGAVYRIAPDFGALATGLARVTVLTAAGPRLALAGTDPDGVWRLVVHDTATGSETQLLGDQGIEVQRMGYSSAEGRLVFQGVGPGVVIGSVTPTQPQTLVVDPMPDGRDVISLVAF